MPWEENDRNDERGRQSALAPPLALALTHSGWYFVERGKRSRTNPLFEVMVKPLLVDDARLSTRGDMLTKIETPILR
jgi:hypothetical protein